MRERFFNSLVIGAVGFSLVVLLLVFPALHATIVIGNFVLHCAVLGLQLVLIRIPRAAVPWKEQKGEPFVSIHLPAHNEPPELLRQTLHSLSQLDWSNYEVLVIDNNTADEAVWRPVEEYCRQLGDRFQFFHVENLKGFKAGAMNYIKRFMDPRTEYVFVVDADYVVRRDAIRLALGYFISQEVGLVQFPQDYRNAGPGNIGLLLDFKHFFSGYMNMANRFGCVPATGTLSFLRLGALRAVNGFATDVITEDADLGFRLSCAGFRSVYANQSIGKGVLPHDLESLKKQRWRWAFGNAQILKLNWRRMLLDPGLTWRQRIGFISHLTAWFNFNLIPSLSLILLAPAALLEKITVTQHHIVILSGFTLVTYMVMRFGTMFYSLRREGHSLGEVWRAYLTHIGLGWVSSASWIRCLWNHRAPFVRTNKFIGKIMPGPLRLTLVEFFLALGLLGACAILAFSDFFIGPIAAMLMGAGRFLVYDVWRQTEYTLQISRRIEEGREKCETTASKLEDGWGLKAESNSPFLDYGS